MVWSGTVHATDASAKGGARDLANEAKSDFDAGRFEDAGLKFQRAYEIAKVPTLAVWAARALVKRDQLVAASELYRQAAMLTPNDLWVGDVQQQAQADAEKELAELQPRIPKLRIRVEGAAANEIEVTVDGVKLAATLFGINLPTDPGRRHIVGKRGAEVVDQRIGLAKGDRKETVLRFNAAPTAPSVVQAQPPTVTEPRIPAQPAQSLGKIHIAATGPGKVSLDGQDKGTLPLDMTDLYPGTYHVRVELDDGTVDERDVEVAAGRVKGIFVASSPAQIAFLGRKGLHLGFEVGGGPLHYWPHGYSYVHSDSTPFASGGVFLNVGLGPAVDFRAGLRLQLWSVALVGLPVSFRFNIGPVYSITLGANMGYRWGAKSQTNWPDSVVTEGGVFLGPEISLLTFRFGEKNHFEVAMVQGLACPITTNEDHGHGPYVFYDTLAFSRLF
jgi:hypothetical protein